MEETITTGGIEIPKEDRQQTPTGVKALVINLEAQFSAIEEPLKLKSQNSSIPPSQDPQPGKKEKKGKKGGKKDRRLPGVSFLFFDRLLTVFTSLRSQGRSIWDFLIQILPSESTSLLPLTPE